MHKFRRAIVQSAAELGPKSRVGKVRPHGLAKVASIPLAGADAEHDIAIKIAIKEGPLAFEELMELSSSPLEWGRTPPEGLDAYGVEETRRLPSPPFV